MKTFLLLLLAILALMVGCAPGYYEKRGYGEEAPGYYETKKWYQNPETGEQQRMRIWRLDSGR